MLSSIVMLMLVPGVTKARSYYSVRYRTRWSPYVHGLVSGDIYYSPYAFRHGYSGLVSGNVRYSPYAFSYKHPSGLVADFGCCYSCYSASYTQPTQSFEEMKKAHQKKMRVRKARIKALRNFRKGMIAMRENDGWRIICDYLKSKNIDFKIRNRLCIQGKTLCCEFLLRDGHLVKYRNPEAIEQAKANPRYNGFYERYEQDWTEFCKEYTGRIYEIKFVNSTLN